MATQPRTASTRRSGQVQRGARGGASRVDRLPGRRVRLRYRVGPGSARWSRGSARTLAPRRKE